MRIADKATKKSKHSQHKVGAVIVKGGNILSVGYNQLRPSNELNTQTIHAEEHAVLALLKNRRLGELTGADIYVTRRTRGGRVGNATPCPRCHKLLRAVGVRNCFATDDNGQTIRFRLDDDVIN